MLNNNCLLLLSLIVFTINMASADEQDSCDAVEVGTRVICKVFDRIYPQDNGKLSKYFCGCISAFREDDLSLCRADEYDFPDAPRCGALFKSKEFAHIVQQTDNLVKKKSRETFIDKLKVCTEQDEEKLIKAASLLYLPGEASRNRTSMFQHLFPCDSVNDLLVGCRMDFLELAANATIN